MPKLSIEIALLGAEQIKQDLLGIGDAGEGAFKQIEAAAKKAGGFAKLDPGVIAKAVKDLGPDAEKAAKQIEAAVATATQYETLAKSVDLVRVAMGRLSPVARTAVAALGPAGLGGALIAAFGAAVVAQIIRTANAIGEVDAQAIKLGSTVTDFDKLRMGLGQMGIGSEKAATGLTHLQGVIDQLKIERVDKAFKEAQQNIATGWAPGVEQLRILEKAANNVGPAAERAREHLTTLGRPFNDTVTPRFESMVRWAGSVEKALPLISAELNRMGDAGERARLAEMALKGFAAESGNAVAAAPKIIEFLSKMPDGFERSALAIQFFGQEMGTGLVQALRAGGSSLENFKAAMASMTQSEVDAANRMNISVTRIKGAFQRLFEIRPGGGTLTVLDMLVRAMEGLEKSISAGTFWHDFAQAAETALGNIGEWLGELAGKLGSNLWRGFISEAALAGQAVLSYFAELPGNIIGYFAGLGADLWSGLVSGASAAAAAVIGFFASLPGQIAGFFAGLGAGLWSGLVSGASAAATAVVGFFSNLPGQIAGFFAGLGSNLWQGFISAASAAATAVVGFFSNLPGQIAGFFAGLGAGLFDGLVAAAQAAVAKIRGMFSGMSLGGSVGGGGMAHGGIMGGRGTGTSDSNLVWLSRGEHIMPARAVNQPGVLAFLEALRRSGGNLNSVLDRMGHFALGGIPAFAAGGMVGMSNVTIAFPGLPPIGGLRAPGSVVDQLHRAAALAQVRSGGRKPSRYF